MQKQQHCVTVNATMELKANCVKASEVERANEGRTNAQVAK